MTVTRLAELQKEQRETREKRKQWLSHPMAFLKSLFE